MIFANYSSPTRLRGRLTTEFHFGRPGYGESPALDELERPTILLLDEPVTVLDKEGGDPEDIYAHGRDSVERIHLVWRAPHPENQDLRGYGIEVEGKLWPSHTGHHHAPLLMDVLGTRIIDNRDTFTSGAITSRGTGFLIGHGGIVVTNEHVVRRGQGITVTRGFHRSIAEVRHCDPKLDLALLTVPSMTAPAIKVRTWMGPQLGERVFAFGFPLRPVLTHSLNMTEGMVSSEAGISPGRFQISAAIQQGNSGGPVFDDRGNLLGVVVSKLLPSSAIKAPDGGDVFLPENVAFAIGVWPVIDAAKTLSFEFSDGENDTIIAPTALGKVAHQTCVEVERWE